MKNICNDFKDFLNYIKDDPKNVLCLYSNSPFGIIKLKKPVMSKEHSCEYCDKKDHIAVFLQPGQSSDYVWLCINTICLAFKPVSMPKEYQPTLKEFRALEWPKFCEINNLGNLDHNVRFEDIIQSEGKIEYMKKFLKKPQGIIIMQGDKGTGKTFSALGICEFYTRKSTSVIFMTQKQMLNKWLETFKDKELNEFEYKVRNVELLVIDDFGIGEISSGFMSFFMDLINFRTRWDSKGTVITTNLDEKLLSDYCGEALTDRLGTGQFFEYRSEESRRKKIIL